MPYIKRHLARSRLDIRLAFWTCVVAVVGLLPVGYIHVLREKWWSAVVVGCLLLLIIAALLEMWRTQEVPRALMWTASFSAGAIGLLAIHRLGLWGVFWSYPILVLAYFMMGTRGATAFNALFLPAVIVLMLPWANLDVLVRASSALVLTWLFAAVFSANIDRQRRELARLAQCDPLTGVRNRREMQIELERAVHLLERHGTPATLIMLDLDRFKAINDTLGHDTGDRVLMALTNMIQDRLRTPDYLFRYGGEEFVVLAPNARGADGVVIAESLGALLRQGRLAGVHVTASFGVAELAPGENAERWLQRSDEALYRAKRGGRDRTELAPMPDQ